MKKLLAVLVGTALAGGMAYAQEEPMDPTQDPTQEQTPEYGEDVGEWDQQDPMSETEDPMQSEDPMSETQPEESTAQEPPTSDEQLYGQESGMQQHDLSSMSADELKGMTIVSESGEEIGSVDRVGQARVVTVDVGGFLGVGAKTVAIPVSELQMSADGTLQTTLTKEALEARQEFDEQNFTEEGADDSESTNY
ncbi:MAG TPA: PRC-barrel domain-containing protein [Woeseiaceae bacterium]|nr:PRC-barrel domain-containing protein [Woeseiaceae bacterium]